MVIEEKCCHRAEASEPVLRCIRVAQAQPEKVRVKVDATHVTRRSPRHVTHIHSSFIIAFVYMCVCVCVCSYVYVHKCHALTTLDYNRTCYTMPLIINYVTKTLPHVRTLRVRFHNTY
ncbi:unnamed protein product [Spodoptera littoralis]|uniref:Uncharacterized protein n=1 Tax=Spodoptera littoralis TaxID=7109 RepID=A0A9P0IED2_SPOLI|nr:unnamed protein product [Spodoptera littoralis]CAH1646049.1 unnamed protein product [Spodoptera littoralis]